MSAFLRSNGPCRECCLGRWADRRNNVGTAARKERGLVSAGGKSSARKHPRDMAREGLAAVGFGFPFRGCQRRPPVEGMLEASTRSQTGIQILREMLVRRRFLFFFKKTLRPTAKKSAGPPSADNHDRRLVGVRGTVWQS